MKDVQQKRFNVGVSYIYRISLFVYRKLYNKAHSVKSRGWYFYSYIMVEFWGITYNPT